MKKLSFLVLSALLMASCCHQEQAIDIKIVNDSYLDRQQETVEFHMEALYEALGCQDGDSLVVFNAAGEEIPSQVLSNSCHSKHFIFQANVPAMDSAFYTIKVGHPSEYPCQAQATFMPRRKDDMSWENDRAIYRMYGPALVTDPDEGMVSGGLDVWVKRTREMVSQKWYQDEFDGKSSYHNDNGEGLDFYSVGTTLGAGAMAPYIDGKLWKVGSNFKTYTILENGPIRTSFQLDYDAYDVNGKQISEHRLITLDAGSYLNRIVVLYEGNDEEMTVAAGFPFRGFTGVEDSENLGINDCADIMYSLEDNRIAYAEPETENGIIFLGSILTTPSTGMLIADGHVLNCTTLEAGTPIMYYSGGAWSKDGFQSLSAWDTYLSDYATQIQQPLKVSIVEHCCCGDKDCQE